MKTEKEIKKKLVQVRSNKSQAKNHGTDETYRVNCKAEKLLLWVLHG